MFEFLVKQAANLLLSYLESTIKNPCSKKADVIDRFAEAFDESYQRFEAARKANGC